jgi:phytoene dehydrogenase-like protein
MRGVGYDAVVVGAGPNGLSAAIELARAGLSVLLREAASEVGGGARSMELTLPGVIHDPFSAIHPLGVGSPYLSTLPLAAFGLEWVHSPAPLAHPFDDGTAAVLERTIEATAGTLGADGEAYAKLFAPLVRHWTDLLPEILAPIHFPSALLPLARFGLAAVQPATSLARRRIGGGRGAALFSGSAAHAGLGLDMPASAAIGLVLNAAGHAVGWPFPSGGAGRLTGAMAGYLRDLGGVIEVAAPVASLDELPPARLILLDLTPRQVVEVTGDYLPARYRAALGRYRYGPGVFKLDWALDGPIPWRAEECGRAATVHLGGSFGEVSDAMNSAWRGRHPNPPFVLLAQPTLFDSSRAPPGTHTAWAYCHVPNGSTRDMTDSIEAQVERFAPGFRDRIVARSALNSCDLEGMNANLVGGDVNGGAATPGQLFLRPVARLNPYATPISGVFICSASTPPGGGVHGMCGYHAARSALRSIGVGGRESGQS